MMDKESIKTLDADSVALLKDMEGKTLEFIEFHRLKFKKNQVFEFLSFKVDDNKYMLSNSFEAVPFFDDDTEEVAFFKVRKYSTDDEEHLRIALPFIKPIRKKISKILLVNDTVIQKDFDETLFTFQFTRGIIFDLGDTQLAIEKGWVLDELMYIKQRRNVLDNFRKVDKEWPRDEERGSIEFICSREVEEI